MTKKKSGQKMIFIIWNIGDEESGALRRIWEAFQKTMADSFIISGFFDGKTG